MIHMSFELFVSSARSRVFMSATLGACADTPSATRDAIAAVSAIRVFIENSFDPTQNVERGT
jgi:hypothetical protein